MRRKKMKRIFNAGIEYMLRETFCTVVILFVWCLKLTATLCSSNTRDRTSPPPLVLEQLFVCLRNQYQLFMYVYIDVQCHFYEDSLLFKFMGVIKFAIYSNLFLLHI
jgi:hypothetical protein